ncbi:MAG: fumarylacetoacetate hydrolase family protein [Pseudomonadota bacterium]
MRLITFTLEGATRTGAIKGDGVVDLNAANSAIPDEMVALLEGGDAMLALAAAAVESSSPVAALSDVKLESPILCPPKILAIGLNYRDHFDEIPAEIKEKRGLKLPTVPVVFNKQSTSASGPYDPVDLPPESPELDYEAELGVVIGKTCRRVPKEKALDVVAGYTVLNDVTIRDWQRATPTMTMGKSWDTHCPMGPAIVTKDEVSDPGNLGVRTIIDGETVQNFNTSTMLFDIASLIAHLSTAFTLRPGDVIASGTGAGVAVFRPGQPFMTAGQICRVEIDQLGHIENRIEANAPSFIH